MNPSDVTTFEIDAQSGQNVSNIGGDQTIYFGDRSRATRVCKAAEAFGLLLSLVGLALLVPVAVATAHIVVHDIRGHDHHAVAHYLSAGWAVAVGLLVVGFVIKRFARITIGR